MYVGDFEGKDSLILNVFLYVSFLILIYRQLALYLLILEEGISYLFGMLPCIFCMRSLPIYSLAIT